MILNRKYRASLLIGVACWLFSSSETRRQNELVTIVDAHPKLPGIGIDEKAAIVVTGDRFRVIGKGRVAIYDNRKHGNNWYYWLENGEVFNLRTRAKESSP